MPKCDECGSDFLELKNCQYCGKNFCAECYDTHMRWELRHKGLAEEISELWKGHREGSEH
jgi:hypothetical protein